MNTWKLRSVLAAMLLVLAPVAARAAEAPSVKATMAFKPLHNDVEYDIPDAKTYDQCKVNVIREGKGSGWVVVGPAGQPLRRFVDTNGDNVVDMWCYYRSGLEVYRDIDTNFNNKIDQSRWLNLGGMRWGLDTNEDGKVDTWKMISADEVSRIAVKALVSQDASLLAPLLITKDDLKELGIKGALETKVLGSVGDAAAKLKKNAAGSKIISPKTNWMRFDAAAPSVIPADQLKTPADLVVYENAMAIVDFGNPTNPGLVQIGELVRIGDVWKLTGIPQPLEGNQIEITPGLVMFHNLNSAPAEVNPTSPVSPKVQELVEKLKTAMEGAPPQTAAKATLEKHFRSVEGILIDLVNEVKTDEERAQWTRQLVDTIASWVQAGIYPDGVKRLKQIEDQIVKSSPKSPLVSVTAYRRMLAEYALAMQEAEGNDARQKVHEKWLKDLEDYLDKYPKGEDSPDAGLQLAVALEFGGKVEKARTWYAKLSKEYGESPAATRAAGSLKRLDLVGKPLTMSYDGLNGSAVDIKQYRGKVVAVFFWDTRSKLCTEDLPLLKALYEEYRGQGFEIIGVNLDAEKTAVGPYLSKNGVKWPQIYEAGGLESAPARDFGIISLPTMFLVDGDGKVLNRSVSAADLKSALAEQFKKK